METKEDVMREARMSRAAVRHLWEKSKITYRPIVMVVFAMALDDRRTYEQVLQDWADYEQIDEGHRWPASRWNSEICYRLLKAGVDTKNVAAWMRQQAREVRELANRISA